MGRKKKKEKELDIVFHATGYSNIDFKETLFSGKLQFYCPIELFVSSQLKHIQKLLISAEKKEIINNYKSYVRICVGKMYKGHKFNLSVPKYSHRKLIDMFRSCSDEFNKRQFSLSRSFCDVGEIEDSNKYNYNSNEEIKKVKLLTKKIFYDVSCKMDHLYPKSSSVPKFDIKFQIFTTEFKELEREETPDIMNTRREYHLLYTSCKPYIKIHLVDIDYHKFFNVYVDIPCMDIIQYSHDDIVDIIDSILLCMQKREICEKSRSMISLPYVTVLNKLK